MKFMTLFLFVLIVMVNGLPALAQGDEIKAFTDFAREQGVALALLSMLVINYVFFEAPRRNKAEMAMVAAQVAQTAALDKATIAQHEQTEVIRTFGEKLNDCPHRGDYARPR